MSDCVPRLFTLAYIFFHLLSFVPLFGHSFGHGCVIWTSPIFPWSQSHITFCKVKLPIEMSQWLRRLSHFAFLSAHIYLAIDSVSINLNKAYDQHSFPFMGSICFQPMVYSVYCSEKVFIVIHSVSSYLDS